MDTIQELKDGLTAMVVFKNAPTQEHADESYEAAKGLRRILPEGSSVLRTLAAIDKAIDWQLDEIADLQRFLTIEEAKREAWKLLHPDNELTEDEEREIEGLKNAIMVLENCDAHNTWADAQMKISKMKQRIRELRGEYDPLAVRI